MSKKNKNAKLYASRFLVILLSIFTQAIAVWVFFYLLGQKYIAVSVGMYVIGITLLLYIENKEQNAVYKMPWIILFLIFPFAGLMTYVTFGNVKMSKRQVKKFREIFSENNDEIYSQQDVIKRLESDGGKGVGIVKYLRNVTSLPVYDNSFSTYLESGERFCAYLEEKIKKAEKYVFLEYFIIEDGVMWEKIRKALIDKVKSGVKVYLMYDDVGSMQRVSPSFYRSLQKEGINAQKFNKFKPIVSVSHNNRDHRKIAVIDGVCGFMGGANIADEYINVEKPFGRWCDSAVYIEGQAVDSLVKLFIQLYNMTGGENLDEKDFLKEKHTQFKDGYIMPFGDSPAPVSYEHIAENCYLDVINRSDKYLYISTPYLIVDTNFLTALKNASRRGVDVRIIIPEIPDKKLIYLMTRSQCCSLMEAGVKVYRFRGGFIHSKNLLSDGDTSIVGTVNLDYRSFVHHFECATLMYKTKSIENLYADFNRLFDYECTLITANDLKLNPFEKLIKSIINIFATLM